MDSQVEPFRCREFLCFSSISGHPEIDSIDDFAEEERLEDREMVVRYRNAKGELRCHGGRHLKSSQAYPKQSLVKKMENYFKIFQLMSGFVYFKLGVKDGPFQKYHSHLQAFSQVWRSFGRMSHLACQADRSQGQQVSSIS